jgi:membrane-bound serine protease (ClpP class)
VEVSQLTPISWWLLALLIVIVVGLLALIIILTTRTYRGQVSTGKEDLKGKIAVVQETLNPEGIVFYQGDLWKALSDSGMISPGEEVIITEVRGLKLLVKKK